MQLRNIHFSALPNKRRKNRYLTLREANIRYFVAKSVMPLVTRPWEGGGSQKVTSDDKREGGFYPQKMMTSFMNSPLLKAFLKEPHRYFSFQGKNN